MTWLLRTLLLGLALVLGASGAQAQNCSGQAGSGTVCGNPNASTGLPSWATHTALLDRAFGTTSGTILNRGSSVWTETSTPTLGANGGTGGSITLNGSTSGAAAIGVKAAAGSTVFNLPVGNGSLNNVLVTDGSGNTSWVSAGSGTVSSVGLSMPGIFTVTGSPVVNTGTLTATLNTQSANLVWAGPTTGAASAPTFRSLVGADLPNPSASTLGGIQSTTGASHQWLSTISTSGVPGLTQPAFTDISGTLGPSQCPNPSASTIGCVESYVAVAHQWINTISTSGVPSSTQPVFGDIGGQSTLAQLPSISNNSLLSNISGGTATPLANSLTSIIDNILGSTQGDVLYRSGTVWTALGPGTSGQVLTTAGAAANPSWTTVTGTGTVTSIATNNGVTGGTITTTGTIGLASISTGNVLGNVSGISAAPTATTPTQVLDVIGSTEGSVLYRGASVWTALTPGTNGQFLQTTGAGSTPQWATNSWNGQTGAVVSVVPAQGRITLASHVPVMASSQTAQTTLYYDSYTGNQVPYYTGTADTVDTIGSNEVSSAMQSSSTGVLNANGVFDVWWEGNTHHNICVATNGSGGGWASDTAGSNTARGTGYSQIDRTTRPYPTNANSVAHCYNGATDYGSITANKLTYLGTILTDAGAAGSVSFTYGSSASGGGLSRLGVWNSYNRVDVGTSVVDSGASYTYTTNTAREERGSSTYQITFVFGLSEDAIGLNYNSATALTANVGSSIQTGFGLDTNGAFSGQINTMVNPAAGTYVAPGTLTHMWQPGVGLHTVYGLELGDGSHANTFNFNGSSNGNTLQAKVRM